MFPKYDDEVADDPGYQYPEAVDGISHGLKIERLHINSSPWSKRLSGRNKAEVLCHFLNPYATP